LLKSGKEKKMKISVVNTRNKRVLIILLAALMLVGLSFAGAPNAYADGTVTNPNDNYDVPQAGYFTFEGTGFTPNDAVTVKLASSGATLATFTVNASGIIVTDTGSTTTRVVIPAGTATGDDELDFYTTTGGSSIPEATCDITVTLNDYAADITSDINEDGDQYIQVSGTDWAPNVTVNLKIDLAPGPGATTFTTDANGNFGGTFVLPSELSGDHIITLLAPASGAFGPASVSKVLTFAS
jgi:hypothetical protein